MFIKAKNIKKTFNIETQNIEILKGINLTINFNEFVAVMGSSGSGKSTLLYILSLLDKPDSGEILINNTVMNSKPEKEKTKIRLEYIGYVFQNFYLLNDLKLYENVALSSIASGATLQEAYKRAKILLKNVGLSSQINKYPTQLSGGQQQRVAIARALMNKPLILFADEPTANLDSKTSLEIMQLFKTLQKEMKLTIIMVTHEQEFRKMVDRVIDLKDGKIVE